MGLSKKRQPSYWKYCLKDRLSIENGIMESTILVIAEHFDGELRPVTHELLTCARDIQGPQSVDIVVVVIGEAISDIAHEIAHSTGLNVVAIKIPIPGYYSGDQYKSIIGKLVDEFQATYVCIPATTQGSDFAPGLAVRLSASCVTGVERVFLGEGNVCFARSLYNGKIVAEVSRKAATTVITVQPGSFKPFTPENPEPGAIDWRTAEYQPGRSKSLEVRSERGSDSALAEASVIVSAGRGIGKQENLDLVKKVASMFPKAAVAGSRPVCDAGWLEYRLQVGLTGASVSPDLYVACGISGAQQHLSGMRSSKFIVAINTDPEAAIFNLADICIVEDLEGFLPALIDLWEESHGIKRATE
jgi:electron transfer flavoprotein alpha subunit